jgi:hypothetical protein
MTYCDTIVGIIRSFMHVSDIKIKVWDDTFYYERPEWRYYRQNLEAIQIVDEERTSEKKITAAVKVSVLSSYVR